MKQQLELAKGPFKSKYRQEHTEKLDTLQNQISLAKENRKIMNDVGERIENLKNTSAEVQASLNEMEQELGEK